MVTRRALLGAAVVLAGCGEGDTEPPRQAEESGGASSLADVALLNDALAAEQAAAALLPRSRAHVRTLEREIARLRGRVERLQRPPAPPDAEAAADDLIALYVDMLAKLAEARLRQVVGGLLADASTAAAELRVERGEPAAPGPFVAGRPA